MIEKIKQYKKFIIALVGAAVITAHDFVEVLAELGPHDLSVSALKAGVAFATATGVALARNAVPVPDADLDDTLPQDDEYVAVGE